MLAWLYGHEAVLWWLVALSIVTFVGTLIALPLLVARLPADYFTRHRSHTSRYRHPVLWLLGILLKNLLGVSLVLAGVAMLVLPGQGVLTILLGLMFMNFPGKRRLEQRIVQQPTVFQAMNWMRARAHQPPLERPDTTIPTAAHQVPHSTDNDSF